MKLPFFGKKKEEDPREKIEQRLYAIRGGGAEGKNMQDVNKVVKGIADTDSG